jgi:DNA topoisomerase VI subunit B
METSKLPQTEEEIDSELKEVREKLQEILESPSYNPKNAKDFETLEKTLQALARKQADLIAAKKNLQRIRG